MGNFETSSYTHHFHFFPRLDSAKRRNDPSPKRRGEIIETGRRRVGKGD